MNPTTSPNRLPTQNNNKTLKEMENCAGQIQKTLSDLCTLFWVCQNKIQSKNIYEFSSPQTIANETKKY